MYDINEIMGNPIYHTKLTIGVGVVFTILMAIIYAWDPYSLTDKYPAYTIFLVLFLFMMGAAVLNYNKDHTDIMGREGINDFTSYIGKLFLFIGISVGIIMILVFAAWIFRNHGSAKLILHSTLLFIFISGMIGIAVLLFKNNKEIADLNKFNSPENKQFSYFTLLKKMFFYIPCLFILFANFIKEQYNITAKPVWIILLLEMIIIGANFLLPYIFNNVALTDGTRLLSDPIYLNNATTIGTFENLHKKITGKNKYNYQYALSTWIYLNPQPPNTSEAYSTYTQLLNYGGKPVIEYNGTTNTIRVHTKTKKNEFVTVYSTKKFAYQKWMNFVMNYDGANMDVFLDGELVGTQPNIAPYMSYDKVVAGKKDGIHGGICNVVYYDKPLSRSDITMSYHLLKHLDIPVS
jgi:hypothetical protein